MTKIVSSDWIISESCRFESLTIEPGVSVTAPEGKYITLTVNGVGHTIEPGTYEGDVAITLCDNFTRMTLRFGEETISNFHAGAIINDGKIVTESSVPAIIRGGKVTDTGAKDISIDSREWDFNGFYITGRTDYTIDNLNMYMVGDGTDDFVGMGAGIAATGTAKVTINNSKIHTDGIGRGTLYVGGDAEVTMNDCQVSTVSPVPTKEQLAEGLKMQRMMEPPWAIGLRGNGRTLNLAENGKLNLNHCHMLSNAWGVLSVDGARVNRMNVKDSLIEITGTNGYGCFCICDDFMFDYKSLGDYGCIDTIDHSVFNVAYTGVLMSLGNNKTQFTNASVVNSGRFGAFIHRNNHGLLRVDKKSVINSGASTVVVKGSNTYFEFDDAILNPGNGTILQLQDNDDVGMGPDTFFIPVGIEDERDERDLSVAIPDEDVFVTFSNMSTAGNLFNSTTNLMACNRRVPWDADPNAAPPMPGPGMPPPPGGPEGMPGGPGMPPPPGGMPPIDPDGKLPELGAVMPPLEIPTGPDGKPVLRGFMGEDLMGAKNLDVKLVNAQLAGVISAAKATYKEGLVTITKENCEELSNITQTPAAPINNGVIVSVDSQSIWTVTGKCFLTKLSIEAGGLVKAEAGKSLRMLVDGVDTALVPGEYSGLIELEVI